MLTNGMKRPLRRLYLQTAQHFVYNAPINGSAQSIDPAPTANHKKEHCSER